MCVEKGKGFVLCHAFIVTRSFLIISLEVHYRCKRGSTTHIKVTVYLLGTLLIKTS